MHNKLETKVYIHRSNGEVNRSKIPRNEVFSGIWNWFDSRLMRERRRGRYRGSWTRRSRLSSNRYPPEPRFKSNCCVVTGRQIFLRAWFDLVCSNYCEYYEKEKKKKEKVSVISIDHYSRLYNPMINRVYNASCFFVTLKIRYHFVECPMMNVWTCFLLCFKVDNEWYPPMLLAHSI